MPSPRRCSIAGPSSVPVSLLLQLTWQKYIITCYPRSRHKRHTLTKAMAPKSSQTYAPVKKCCSGPPQMMSTSQGPLLTRLLSYIIEAQGKPFCKTRKHIRPIHLNIPAPKAPKQPPKPTVNTLIPSYIPKPNSNLKLASHPKYYLPQTSLCPPSHIPKPLHLPKSSQVPSPNASPSVEQLLQHLSTLNSPSPSVCPVDLSYPQALNHCLLCTKHQ